ncbi:MAG: hypothetical protein OEX83_09385 [Gammaproteobacteria bacterium]|nr:hypothetical protein [Gammaproteobacteria bacterium]
MESFFEGIPEKYHGELKIAIDAVNETNELLRQVKKRFGTNDLLELTEKTGEECDGIVVTHEAIDELEKLILLHESRRQACQAILDGVARSR